VRVFVPGERAAAIGPYTSRAIELLLEDTSVDRRSSAHRLVALADKHSKAVLEQACFKAFEYGEATPQVIRNMITLCTSGSVGEVQGSVFNVLPRFARAAEELVPSVHTEATA